MTNFRNCTLQQSSVNCRDQCVAYETVTAKYVGRHVGVSHACRRSSLRASYRASSSMLPLYLPTPEVEHVYLNIVNGHGGRQARCMYDTS